MAMTKFSRINKQREEITMRVLEDMEKGGNRDAAQRMQASRENAVSMIGDHAIHM